jgi:hypothetical protein
MRFSTVKKGDEFEAKMNKITEAVNDPKNKGMAKYSCQRLDAQTFEMTVKYIFGNPLLDRKVFAAMKTKLEEIDPSIILKKEGWL